MNYLGKHERNMVIRGIELTGKRVAAVELPSRVHTTDQGCGVGSLVIRLRLRLQFRLSDSDLQLY